MKLIHTDKAPAAIGPYSQAVVHQNLIFTSGQIALSPVTGTLVGVNASQQMKQCLENLGFVLQEGGSAIHCIIKVVIFLKNMGDFSSVNEVYQSWLGEHRPARSTVAVSGMPRDALVEVECIATLLNENKHE